MLRLVYHIKEANFHVKLRIENIATTSTILGTSLYITYSIKYTFLLSHFLIEFLLHLVDRYWVYEEYMSIACLLGAYSVTVVKGE